MRAFMIFKLLSNIPTGTHKQSNQVKRPQSKDSIDELTIGKFKPFVLVLLRVLSSRYVEMNLKSEPTKLNGFNFQIISWGGGVYLTWFGVHTYMTGKTLSRQVY